MMAQERAEVGLQRKLNQVFKDNDIQMIISQQVGSRQAIIEEITKKMQPNGVAIYYYTLPKGFIFIGNNSHFQTEHLKNLGVNLCIYFGVSGFAINESSISNPLINKELTDHLTSLFKRNENVERSDAGAQKMPAKNYNYDKFKADITKATPKGVEDFKRWIEQTHPKDVLDKLTDEISRDIMLRPMIIPNMGKAQKSLDKSTINGLPKAVDGKIKHPFSCPDFDINEVKPDLELRQVIAGLYEEFEASKNQNIKPDIQLGDALQPEVDKLVIERKAVTDAFCASGKEVVALAWDGKEKASTQIGLNEIKYGLKHILISMGIGRLENNPDGTLVISVSNNQLSLLADVVDGYNKEKSSRKEGKNMVERILEKPKAWLTSKEQQARGGGNNFQR
jgi:hypothetical protein